jgi:hypothetical protein
MKRTIIIALALVLVFGLATAEAGQRDKKSRKASKKGQRTEMPDNWSQVRYDQFPTMSYLAGMLNRDGWHGWSLDGVSLVLKDDCTITVDGQSDGFLQEGRKAIVMGSRTGDTMVAWSVRVMGMDYSDPTPSPYFRREPGPNPNVGVLKGRVE